ncbi:MAG: hypothetical protein M9962_03830 [Oligoflexia bacterium]|nr:hypothetical protein [Oligoflexia bacterium]
MNLKKIGFVAALIIGSALTVACSDDDPTQDKINMWVQQKMLEEKYGGGGTNTTTTTTTQTQTVTHTMTAN